LPNKTNVSFIIPHKGREEMLIQTVTSILNQGDEQANYEVIVVSQNKSSIELSKLAEQHDNVNISFQDDSLTISALRNLGASQSTGEYLAFLDADIELSKNWLTVMLAEMAENKQRKIIAAIQVESNHGSNIEKIRTVMNNAYADSNVDALAGANLFIHQSDFNDVGGFPEELATCEDIYFTSEIAKSGDLYCTSKAQHVHLGEDKNWKQLFNKEIWRGQSNLKSLLGRSIPLREWPSILVPLWVFFFSIATCFSMLFGHLTAFFVLLSAIAIPVAMYSLRLNGMAKGKVNFSTILKFYLIYFAARAIGTLGGLFKSFSNSIIK